MNIIVGDTCSIIKLQKGGVIELLGKVYTKIYIPEAVKNECLYGVAKEAIKKPFFQIVPVKNVLPIKMGLGEREAISLAIEQGIRVVLTDDEKAYKSAIKNGLLPINSFLVFTYCKK